MMKQLKGLGFLKSLKLLSSILLIGFFGLGVNSFVSANMYIQEIGLNLTNSSSNWQYYINVDDKLNFYSVPTNSQDTYNNILFTLGHGNTGSKYFLGRKGNRLYGYGFYNWSSFQPQQGYVNNIYSIQVNTYGGTELRTFTANQNNIIDTIDNIGNYVNNLTYYSFGTNGGSYAPTLCFTSDTILYTDSGGTQNQWYCLIVDTSDSENYNINNVVNPDTILSTVGFNSSPVNGSGGDSGTGDTNSDFPKYSTNQNVYNSLFQQGYRPQMCYGGFALDDILTSTNNSITNIKVSSGATVFELYEEYGDGEDFLDWYEDNYIDFVYANEFGTEYVDTDFVGKSKGLIGLSIIRQAYRKNSDFQFNVANYKYFCDLYFNFGSTLDTGGGLIGNVEDSINKNVVNDIINNLNFLTPTSGSALSTALGNLCESGDLTGDICSPNFGENKDGSLWDSIQDSRNTWSVDVSNLANNNGILPKYIIVGFLAIVLLYYFRR